MKKWLLIGCCFLFLVLYLFWKELFFGELFYVWFFVLFLETFLLLKKKYKWTFLFLLFVIPITLVISYFFGIYYFWAEVFGALFVFSVFFLYMICLNFKEMSRNVKIKGILGILLFVILMLAFVDFNRISSLEKPIFMILINDTYYGLGYKGSYQIISYENKKTGLSGHVCYIVEFGFWVYPWVFESCGIN